MDTKSVVIPPHSPLSTVQLRIVSPTVRFSIVAKGLDGIRIFPFPIIISHSPSAGDITAEPSRAAVLNGVQKF
jgi:hypothetical protein